MTSQSKPIGENLVSYYMLFSLRYFDNALVMVMVYMYTVQIAFTIIDSLNKSKQ